MWTRLNDAAQFEAIQKHPIRSVVVATLQTALFVAVAVAASVYGAPSAPGWWVVAGFFVFVLGMMLSGFGLARLQQKAMTEGRPFAAVGTTSIGPMLLAGVALLVIGCIGIVSDVLLAGCVATGQCQPVPTLAGPTFLVALTAGAVLLVSASLLATR